MPHLKLLAYNRIDYPKVHDLELMVRVCEENNVETGLNIEILIELSDFAVEGRYAFIYEEVDSIKITSLCSSRFWETT